MPFMLFDFRLYLDSSKASPAVDEAEDQWHRHYAGFPTILECTPIPKTQETPGEAVLADVGF